MEAAKGGDGLVVGLLLDVPALARVAVFGGDVHVRSLVASDAEAPLVLVPSPGFLAAKEYLQVPGLAGAEGLTAF